MLSTLLEDDFEYIAKSDLPWERIKNKKVLVTGGSGYIGSLLIRFMNFLNKKYEYHINIITITRNKVKTEKLLSLCSVQIIEADICNLPEITCDIDFIFHCAAITKSKDMLQNPIKVVEGIVNGTQNILKLAHEKNIKGMVYLSSMEMYGKTDPKLEQVCELDQGYLDIFNIRSCYPIGKRMAENICYLYFKQYGIPVKIARLAQTFGAGILKEENRIFAQFAESVIKGENIILHTDGTSTGNYCYSADAMIGLFTILFKGEDGQAYNIANENTNMMIREMAEIVSNRVAGGKIKVEYDIPEENSYGYAEPVNMKLSSDKIRKLGWVPKYGMEEMFNRMIEDMKIIN